MLAWRRTSGGLLWTEALTIGLAVLGAMISFFSRRGASEPLGRRLAVFTVALTAVYSLIPYKTPWCVLNPLLGMAICGGIGAAWLLGRSRPAPLRAVSGVALVLALGHLAWQSYRTSFVYQVDPRNPYVYAQTVPDAEDIQKRSEALAAVHPDGYRMVVKVFWSDGYYWPIPWYLRRFKNVGYWRGVPAEADAPLIFAAPEYDEELTRRLDPSHLMNGYVGLRPRTVAMVWVRMDLWTKYIESKQRRE
jgi:predicted membrane-bound mannosyltransferase